MFSDKTHTLKQAGKGTRIQRNPEKSSRSYQVELKTYPVDSLKTIFNNVFLLLFTLDFKL